MLKCRKHKCRGGGQIMLFYLVFRNLLVSALMNWDTIIWLLLGLLTAWIFFLLGLPSTLGSVYCWRRTARLRIFIQTVSIFFSFKELWQSSVTPIKKLRIRAHRKASLLPVKEQTEELEWCSGLTMRPTWVCRLTPLNQTVKDGDRNTSLLFRILHWY